MHGRIKSASGSLKVVMFSLLQNWIAVVPLRQIWSSKMTGQYYIVAVGSEECLVRKLILLLLRVLDLELREATFIENL